MVSISHHQHWRPKDGVKRLVTSNRRHYLLSQWPGQRQLSMLSSLSRLDDNESGVDKLCHQPPVQEEVRDERACEGHLVQLPSSSQASLSTRMSSHHDCSIFLLTPNRCPSVTASAPRKVGSGQARRGTASHQNASRCNIDPMTP